MIKLFLSSLILICLICIDYQYANLTFESSNLITIDIQHLLKNDNNFIEYVIQFFSQIGDRTIMQFIMIFIWLKSKDIIEAIKILIMYSISSFTIDLIKMVIQQPRPFYIDNNIQLAFCHTGFGGPSGHACRALVFYSIIFKSFLIQNRTNDYNLNYKDMSQLIGSQQINYKELNYAQTNRLLYYVGLPLFITLTGFARLYFGVHFLNQIFLGWIIGLYLLYLYYKCGFEDYLDLHLNIVIKCQEAQNLSISIGLFLKLLILVLISFLCYYICLTSDSIQEIKNNWIIMVNQQKLCYGSEQRYYNSFEKHDIIGTSVITFPFFIYIMLRLNNNTDINQYKISNFLTKEGLFQVALLLILILAPIHFRRYIKSYVLHYDYDIILQYILVGIVYFLQTSVALLILFPFFSQLLMKKSCFNQKEINLETQEIEL